MESRAGHGSLPLASGTGRPVPEAEPAIVERWRSERGELVELLAQVRERCGGVAAFRLGPSRTVLVTDPSAVQHVLARYPERYVKRSHRARLLIGDGVLAATGTAWKRQRRLLQSQFTGTGMRRYEQRITEAARTTAGRWASYARTGQSLDVGREMRRFALDAIWRSLTGHPLDDDTERELDAVAVVATALPTLPADASEARDAVAADLARIDAVAGHAIEAARNGAPGPEGPGLLRVLTDAGAEHPEYTDQLIRDELVTLLAAGHETTATTLTWLYLLLDQHPAAREQTLGAAWRRLAGAPSGHPGPDPRDAPALPVRVDPAPPRRRGRRARRLHGRGGHRPPRLPVPHAPRSRTVAGPGALRPPAVRHPGR